MPNAQNSEAGDTTNQYAPVQDTEEAPVPGTSVRTAAHPDVDPKQLIQRNINETAALHNKYANLINNPGTKPFTDAAIQIAQAAGLRVPDSTQMLTTQKAYQQAMVDKMSAESNYVNAIQKNHPGQRIGAFAAGMLGFGPGFVNMMMAKNLGPAAAQYSNAKQMLDFYGNQLGAGSKAEQDALEKMMKANSIVNDAHKEMRENLAGITSLDKTATDMAMNALRIPQITQQIKTSEAAQRNLEFQMTNGGPLAKIQETKATTALKQQELTNAKESENNKVQNQIRGEHFSRLNEDYKREETRIDKTKADLNKAQDAADSIKKEDDPDAYQSAQKRLERVKQEYDAHVANRDKAKQALDNYVEHNGIQPKGKTEAGKSNSEESDPHQEMEKIYQQAKANPGASPEQKAEWKRRYTELKQIVNKGK